jgi:ABC-type sugar transport system, permease component
MNSKALKVKNYIFEVVMLLITLIVGYPIFVMAINVFKTPMEMANWIALPDSLYFENITKVMTKGGFPTSLLNSVVVTGISILFLVVFGSMAAFPMGRKREKVFSYLYIYLTLGIMLPMQFSILPLFQLIKSFGIMNTRVALIACEIAFNMAVTVFVYKNFIKSVPAALEEAATIDGCTYFGLFWKIVFPLLKPATATVIITALIAVWNDFLGPLLIIRDSAKKTLPVMIIGFRGQYGNDIGGVFTTITFASLPLVILFLFLQKYFYKGISAGAVKS